jgi:Sel1 repeat
MKKAGFGTVLFLAIAAGALAQSTPCAMPTASASEQTLAETEKVCRASAERGDAKSQYFLALMYHQGKGVAQDYTEALRWYRKAADQGDAKAQYGVCYMYRGGQGVPQDYTEGLRWCRKAADQGNPKAQYSLGLTYRYGEGVQQDRAEADHWFHKAADQGDESGQRILGLRGNGLSTLSKVSLSAMSLWCLLFLKDSLATRWSFRSRHQQALTMAELLGLTYVGLSLYGAFGVFQSVLAANAFHFIRHLVAGILIAVLLSVFGPRSAKLVLGASSALFIAINILTLVIAHHDPRRLAGIRGCYAANGLLIGVSIPLAFFLWLQSRKPSEDAVVNK